MAFIRFVNKTIKSSKYIGFEIKEIKCKIIFKFCLLAIEIIFDLLLQTICDFTMPESFCTIFYKSINRKIYVKRYFKKSGNSYHINGDFWQLKN